MEQNHNRHVARSKRVWLVVLFALMGGGLAAPFLLKGPPDPVYQDRPLSAWLEDLGDKIPEETRTVSGKALQQAGTNVVPYLVQILEMRESRFRKSFVTWVNNQRIVKYRITPLADRQKQAVYACWRLGPVAKGAIPALSELLAVGDFPDPICRALYKIGPEGVRVLSRALSDPHAEVRLHAADKLAWYNGPEGALAVPELVASLKDNDAKVRARAAQALGAIHANPDLALPALVGNLQDSDYSARATAITAIGLYRSQAESVVPALLKGLDDTNSFVRSATVQSVGWICARPELVVPELIKKLHDPDRSIQYQSMSALEKYGLMAKDAIPELQAMTVNGSDAGIRATAKNVLSAVESGRGQRFSNPPPR